MSCVRWVGRLLTISAFTTSIAGCTLLLVSTDGLSGGGDGTEGGGGGRGGNDGAGGAGGDGSSGTDGPGRADGSEIELPNDGGIVEDSSLGFCAANPGHTFCDDFDDRADVTKGWATDLQGRGVVRGETSRLRSAPRSFVSETPAGGTKMVSVAALRRVIAASADRVRFSFDVYVTPPGGNVGDSFATIHFNNLYLDFLWFETGAFWVTERNGGPNIDHVGTKPIPPGTWVRVQVESTPGRIVATVNGVTTIDTPTSRTYSGQALVSLGLYSEDALAIAFTFDNAIADTTF
jgi:hypothetical protein